MTTCGKTILVCDDDVDICEMLAEDLRESGYETHCAFGHRDVMAHLGKQRPDVILMDVCMPEKDGFMLAEELRGGGFFEPIIFMTAFGGVTYRLFAPVFRGKVSYLRKPIEPEELLAKIERISGAVL